MSKPNKLADLSNQQLIDEYVDLSRQQGAALEKDDTQKFNRLFDKFVPVREEIRRRGDEVRKELIPLLKRSPDESRLDYGAAQRRRNAAFDLMAIVPDLAKATLEELAKSPLLDISARASLSLSNLEDGIWKPS